MIQTQLDKIYSDLQEWKAERRLTIEHQRAGLLGNICEKLTEYFRAQNDLERIDALCDIVVFSLNACEELSMPENVCLSFFEIFTLLGWAQSAQYDDEETMMNFAFTSIALCALNTIKNMDYDPYLCMQETIKEISSRTGKYDESIGKWIKDSSDEAKAKWYKADYERCRYDIRSSDSNL